MTLSARDRRARRQARRYLKSHARDVDASRAARAISERHALRLRQDAQLDALAFGLMVRTGRPVTKA